MNLEPQSQRGEFLERSYAAEAGPRSYRLYLPAGFAGSEPRPLLVMLHGCTQDATDFARGTRMNDLADSAGVLVAYPEQPAAAHPQRCWNWYDPAHQERGAGEPALIDGITREIMDEYAVDPDRVYIAGVSAGGAMAITLAATYPELYAAVGSHSGVPYRAAGNVSDALTVMREGGAADGALLGEMVSDAMGEQARSVPVILFHGAADSVVSVINTEHVRAQWLNAMRQIDDDMDEGPIADEGEVITPDRYRAWRTVYGDAGNILVEEWTVEGLGHAWSGGSPEGTYTDPQGPDASREILRFLLEHPRR